MLGMNRTIGARPSRKIVNNELTIGLGLIPADKEALKVPAETYLAGYLFKIEVHCHYFSRSPVPLRLTTTEV
jgi:hypothetical protein